MPDKTFAVGGNWTNRCFDRGGGRCAHIVESYSEYSELQKRMYALLSAQTVAEKYTCNVPFIHVCQEILERKKEELNQELLAIARDSGTAIHSDSAFDRLSYRIGNNRLSRPLSNFLRSWRNALGLRSSKTTRGGGDIGPSKGSGPGERDA